MKIIDISIPIQSGMTVYPNNPEVLIESVAKIAEGASSDVSRISFGSHTGTHVDAPKHATAGAGGIDSFPLSHFYGPAKVFDLSHLQPGDAVKVADLESKEISSGDRILLKTSNSARGYGEFYNDFVYLDGDAAEFLTQKGVVLVGIDYLSIKQKGSKDNRPHTALLSKNIAILEGIDLGTVAEGAYTLAAFPLNIPDSDGSPVRSVLLQDN